MQPPFAPDPLDLVLQTLQPRGAFLYRSILAGPWGFTAPAGLASFHVVMEGACVIDLDGHPETLHVAAGDLVILPNRASCAFRDVPGRPAPPLETTEAYLRREPGGIFRIPGEGPTTELICGGIAFDEPAMHPLLDVLPPALHLPDAVHSGAPRLAQTLEFLACEARSSRPGAETLMGHLGSVLFIQAVRAFLEEGTGCANTWLGALQDPYLGRALSALHAAPEAPWTVGALASEAGLSRSAFAARFREAVGEPPMQHVTRWRVFRAARLLQRERLTMAEVADRVGYANEAAFSRTFKRWMGRPPSAFRAEPALTEPQAWAA